MTNDELQVLLEAAQALNLRPAELKAVNPFTQQGKVAESLQIAAQSVNPLQAAKWAKEAGQEASLEAAAALAGVIEMTADAHKSLMESDPDYLVGVQEAQARREAELLQRWEAEVEEKEKARGIDSSKPRQPRNWQERWAMEQAALKEREAAARRQVQGAG